VLTMTQKKFIIFSWSIFSISIIIPLIVWGSGINWGITSITPYQWFPLFGLLAWMIMWTHYINGAIRIKKPELKKPKYYENLTAYIVLASLLLHPGLLAYAQWSNEVGIPPQSFYNYVGDELKLAVILGSVALIIFLSFEIFNRLKNNKSVQNRWLAISISQSIAMTLIFIHGLRLGNNISSGWFMYVWIFYGLTLIPCFYIIHINDLQDRTKKQSVV
jgi:hypothetical protein